MSAAPRGWHAHSDARGPGQAGARGSERQLPGSHPPNPLYRDRHFSFKTWADGRAKCNHFSALLCDDNQVVNLKPPLIKPSASPSTSLR